LLRSIELPIRQTRFRFEAKVAGRWPVFSGSAWHGAFGRALRRISCVTRAPVCDGCQLARHCPYPLLFEGGGGHGHDRLRRIERVAQPYVIAPAGRRQDCLALGECVDLRLALVGQALNQSAYARLALREAGRGGVGPDRIPLEVVSETELQPPQPSLPSTGTLHLRFLTPLRVKRDGDLVTPDRLQPGDLLMTLVRRVSMLASFHGHTPIDTDFAALKSHAWSLSWRSADLHWRETVRFSSRQMARLHMGGVVGRADVDAAAVAAFAPFLALLPALGAGKGASMGLGQVAIGSEAPE
jgi:hypothetical protein